MKFTFPVRIYVIALCLRLIPIILTSRLGIGLDDMFQYDMLARSLASGNGYRWYAQEDLKMLAPYVNFDLSTAEGYDTEYGLYTSFRAPLYPAFLAIVYFICGTGPLRFFAARLAQAAFLGAPLAPLTYYVAKHFSNGQGDERIAKFSAWIVGCYPILIVYPIGLGTENLFFVLLLAAFLFVLKSINNPAHTHLLLSGIFLGLTALTRSVILPFAGIALLYMIYFHGKKAVTAIIVFILIITPWILRNTLLHDKLTGIETSMGYNLYLGYHPQGDGSFIFGPSLDLLSILDDSKRDEIGMQIALGFIGEQPERFIPLAINRLGFFFGLEKRVLMYFYSNNLIGYLSKPVLLAIALFFLLPFIFICTIGLLGASLMKWTPQISLLLLLLTFYLLPHIFILAEDRFHLALIPFIAILAAKFWVEGIRAVSARWREADAGKWMVTLAVIGIFLLFMSWGIELSRDAEKITILFGPNGNTSHFSY